MLMSIRVRDRQSGLQHAFDLRPQLAFDIVHAHASRRISRYERRVVLAEQSVRADERRDVLREGTLFDEREMNPDGKRRHIAQSLYGMLERRAVRDDAARRDDPFLMCANGAVGHAAMQRDVVSRDDESLCHLRVRISG